MKPLRLFSFVLCVILCCHPQARAQDMDTELAGLADKLATSIKDNAKTKVAVLDFTDLQGGSDGELGKYIAEQLTVDLVMGKRDFTVLDRANLKKILAEHKLTATGLIDPDNAKKLGMFAGVDALILGTIIPKGTNISLTVKIITTDTAEIVGAARAQFVSDDTVRQLIAKPATAETGAYAEPVRKLFGDLDARVESISLLPGDNIYGYARLTLVITNMSETTTYGVAVNPDFYNKFNLSNNRGDEFKATEVSGINTAFEGFGGYRGSMSEIPPRSAIRIISKSQVRWAGTPGEYRPYHFQTEIVFGPESNGRHPSLTKYNLVLDVQ